MRSPPHALERGGLVRELLQPSRNKIFEPISEEPMHAQHEHARDPAGDARTLKIAVALGPIWLAICVGAVLFAEPSWLTVAVLTVGSLALCVAPGWALLTLHGPDEDEVEAQQPAAAPVRAFARIP